MALTSISSLSVHFLQEAAVDEAGPSGGNAVPVVPKDGAAAAAAAPAPSFTPAASFAGMRPGTHFKLGPQGLGYYADGVEQGPAAGKGPLNSHCGFSSCMRLMRQSQQRDDGNCARCTIKACTGLHGCWSSSVPAHEIMSRC